MSAEYKNCLINEAACGRTEGNPICPKCGMDERVVYPGQADLESALQNAKVNFWKTHAQQFEQRLRESTEHYAEQVQAQRACEEIERCKVSSGEPPFWRANLNNTMQLIANGVGKHGVIRISSLQSCGVEFNWKIEDGSRCDMGLLDAYFSNVIGGGRIVGPAKILIIDELNDEFAQIFLTYVKSQGKPVVIFTQNVEKNCRGMFQVSVIRGEIDCGIVLCSDYLGKPWLEDLAIRTGGVLLEVSMGGIEDLKGGLSSILGSAKIVDANMFTTILKECGGRHSDIEARVAQIRKNMEQAAEKHLVSSSEIIKNMHYRIAFLAGGVAIVNYDPEIHLASELSVEIGRWLATARQQGWLGMVDFLPSESNS
jgi:hypothetical protein